MTDLEIDFFFLAASLANIRSFGETYFFLGAFLKPIIMSCMDGSSGFFFFTSVEVSKGGRSLS